MTIFGGRFGLDKPTKISNFNELSSKPKFVFINTKIEAVLANQMGAKYLVAQNISLARQLQALANDYLFDARIALMVRDDDELNAAIDARIDCAIYK